MSLKGTFLLISLLVCGCATNANTGVVISSCHRETNPECCQSTNASGLLGNYLDEQQQKSLRSSPRTLQRMDRGDPLTVDDVIRLHHADVRDRVIIRYIQDSGATYSLNETQIRRLRDAGVNEDVIDYMRCGEG